MMMLLMGTSEWVRAGLTTSGTVGALLLAFWIMVPVDQRRYEFVYIMMVISPVAQPWYAIFSQSRLLRTNNATK